MYYTTSNKGVRMSVLKGLQGSWCLVYADIHQRSAVVVECLMNIQHGREVMASSGLYLSLLHYSSFLFGLKFTLSLPTHVVLFLGYIIIIYVHSLVPYVYSKQNNNFYFDYYLPLGNNFIQ